MKLPNLRDPKVKLAAGGAAAVVAFALYQKRHGGASAPASSTTAGNPSGAAGALGDANLQSAVYDSLESQYQGLNARLSKLQHIVNVIVHRPYTPPKAASPHPPVQPKPPPSKTVPIAPTKVPPVIQQKRSDFLPAPLQK